MKFSEYIEALREQGLTKTDALKTAKAHTKKVGKEWDSARQKIFDTHFNTSAPKASGTKVKLIDVTHTNEMLTQVLRLGAYFVAWINGSDVSKLKPVVFANKDKVDAWLSKYGMPLKTYNKLIAQIDKGKKYGPDFEEEAWQLGEDLSEIEEPLRDYKLKIPQEKLTFLHDIVRYVYNEDPRPETAYKAVVKKIAGLACPQLSSLFTAHVLQHAGIVKINVKQQGQLLEELNKLAKKIGADSSYSIPTATRTKLKGTELLLTFNSLKSKLDLQFKAKLREIVETNGSDLIDVHKAIKAFDSLNMYHTLPKGFDGFVDAEGKFYTVEKYPLGQRPIGMCVMKNNGKGKYDSKTGTGIYCTWKLPGGTDGKAWTTNHNAAKESHKGELVKDFFENAQEYRNEWFKDIKKGHAAKPSNNFVMALITELMYQLSPRVGSSDQRGGKLGDGATTGFTKLTRTAFTITKTKITVEYADKGVSPQHLEVTPASSETATSTEARLVFDDLYTILQGKKPHDPVFVNDKRVPISYGAFCEYLKETVHEEFTPKVFRTIRASYLAKLKLDKAPFKVKANQDSAFSKKVNDYFVSAMKEVGAALGHHSGEKVTEMTAIKNYIDPSVMNEYFEKFEVRPKPVYEKALKSRSLSSTIRVVVRSKK